MNEKRDALVAYLKRLNKKIQSLREEPGVNMVALKSLRAERNNVREQIALLDEKIENEKGAASNKKASKTVKKENKNDNTFLGVSILALALALTSLSIVNCNSKEKSNSKNNNNVIPAQTPYTITVVTPTPTSEPTPYVLENGVYGTFLDINDDRQVMARANYIYDHYLGFIEELNLPMGNVTVEDIANIIRVENGRLPIDENGQEFYKEDLTDEYGNLFAYVVCDLPSSPKLGRLEHVPSSLFVPDNCNASLLLGLYDTSYQKFVDAYNNDDREEMIEAAKEIGNNILQTWIYQGMYNGYNPYILPEENLSFAFTGSMFKFPQYVTELNLGTKKAVCIPTCTDYESGKVVNETVNNIYVAAVDNSWDYVNHKLAGKNRPDVERDCVVFDSKLQEILKSEALKAGLINERVLK